MIRKYCILLLILLLPVLANAQTGGFYGDAATRKANSLLGAVRVLDNLTSDYSKILYRLEKLEKPHEPGSPKGMYYNKLYLLGEITDSTSIFTHTKGIYLGEYIQDKNRPTFKRNGFGIERIIDDSSISDVIKYEYYIGFYKKNRRHGEGYLVKTSGKIVTGIWKRGRLKLFGRRDLTDDEQEKIQDYIRQLNNLM